MDIILKSNRKSFNREQLFSIEDIRIVHNLLDISAESISQIIKFCRKIKENELTNLVSTKAITYANNEVIFFEDKTFILKTETNPLALASIIIIETMGVEYLEEFSKWLFQRIAKIKRIKELHVELKKILKEKKDIERSIFPFKITPIPNTLKIIKKEDGIIIQKEKNFASFKILVEAKFYHELLQELCFYYKNHRIPLSLKNNDKDLEFLFSPTFYQDVEKFLDLEEYEEEIAGIIKTVINLSEGT